MARTLDADCAAAMAATAHSRTAANAIRPAIIVVAALGEDEYAMVSDNLAARSRGSEMVLMEIAFSH